MKSIKTTMEGILYVVLGTTLPQLTVMTDLQAAITVILSVLALAVIHWVKARDYKVKPKPKRGSGSRYRTRSTSKGKRRKRKRKRRNS